MSFINSYACDKKCPDELMFSNQAKVVILQLQIMENLIKFGGMKTFSIFVDNNLFFFWGGF